MLDAETFEGMRKELVRWGYHYNQAVRSLNAIALFIKNGTLDDDWFETTFEKVASTLDEVNIAREDLGRSIDSLQDKIVIGGD